MAAETVGAPGEDAPAKVNLYLHILGRRADGFHILESLAVFPSVGDRLTAEPAETLDLSIDGPFAAALPPAGDNLAMKAARALAVCARARRAGGRCGAALTLTKNLPVASGVGGGAADAAAALRLLSGLWRTSLPADLAPSLGADVPVCMTPGPQFVRGIGEDLQPCANLPPFWMVLANPMIPVSTAAAFAALSRRDNPPGPPAPEGGFRGFDDLIGWLDGRRNDMEEAAARLCPPVADVLRALSSAPLARMSGSGATCFALLPSRGAAERLAQKVRGGAPGWWVAAAPVRGA